MSPKNRWGIRENAVAWLSRRARSLDGAWAGFVCSALFSGHGKIALCDGRREKGGEEEERYVDEVRRLSVGYKLVGLYTDWRVYNHRQQCVGWSLVFFRRINGLFHIGEEREGGEAGWSLSKKIFYACETTQCSFFVSIILMAVKRTKLGLKSEIPASVKMIRM